jgi:hypothetical protein
MGDNIKVIGANTMALFISLTEVEQMLQVLVLSATLVYTIAKAVKAIRDFKKE